MPKRKTPIEKPEKQFERFVETAREHGVPEDGKALDEAFKKMTKKPRQPSAKPVDDDPQT